jgi:capsular exopolysaccharide synthesis family protein
MYSSNNQNLTAEKEIDFKNMFDTVKRYKLSIIIIILVSTFLTLFYTLMATKIYQADLKLEIRSKMYGEPSQVPNDSIDKVFDVKGENLENEIAVLQSHFVVSKAAEKLQLGTRYYLAKRFKSIELYKDSPFSVNIEATSEAIKNYKFQINEVGGNRFQLIIEPTMSMKIINSIRSLFGKISEEEKLIYFKGTFAFGEKISNTNFSIIINKQGNMDDNHYYFTVAGNEPIVEDILKELKVTPTSDKSSVFLISYQDNVPLRATDVLSAIAEEYQAQDIETKKESAHKALNYIDKQLENLKSNVKSSANGLEDYKSKHIVMDTKDKAVMTAQKINELEKDRYELEMQEGVYQKLLSDMHDNKTSAGLNTGSIQSTGTPLLALFEKLQEANTLRASLLVDYTEQHPSVIKVNKQIETLKSNLKTMIETTLRGIAERKSILNEILQKNNTVMQELPEEENQLDHLSNNYLLDQKNYEYVVQKRAEIAIAESATVSIVRVLDKPLVGDQPIKPIPLANLLLGVILGLIFGVLQAFTRNFISNTIYTVADIEKHSNLPIMGALSDFSMNNMVFDDAVRVLFTKLMFLPQKPKVINVTSSIEEEGKTTTALALATVMGQSGKKVIVLDLDMRNPKIHQILNLSNEKGMTALLKDECSLKDTIHHTQMFDVICSGQINQNSFALIMSDKLETLLRELTQEYDTVLIRSSSINILAEALILIKISDYNLVIFKAGYSKIDYVSRLNYVVKECEAEKIGIILNNIG